MPHQTGLSRLPLSHDLIDRDADARGDDALFDRLLRDSATRVVTLWRGSVLSRKTDGPRRISYLTPDDVTSGQVRVYLGRTREATSGLAQGTPMIAMSLSDGAARELAPSRDDWVDVRSLVSSALPVDAAVATQAVAIVNWHSASVHCRRCGMPTVVMSGGWMRYCFSCETEEFPRTDPAVIAAVVDSYDRLLLGTNTAWNGTMWSLLAGFVEPGEPFEAAVRREVSEESGVQVGRVEYVGSQPWPFPASVMVGFWGYSLKGAAPRPDGEEIADVRWFSRDELWAGRDSIGLPGPSSIAHALISRWYGGPLDQPPPVAV